MTESDDTQALAEQIATAVKERATGDDTSRRQFLSRSAVVGGSLLALGGGTGFAMGQESDEADAAENMTASFDDVEGTDIDVVNYALTLEHLENAFYRDGLEMFDRSDFEDAEIVQNYSSEFGQSLYTTIEVIGEHEASHAGVLSEAVSLLGGEPVAEASYDFGVETVGDFLAVAQVLENTGVSAYAGAAPFIESPDLQSAALSIHSVEARHAAFLNTVNGETPFPDAYDPALSQDEVLSAAGQFIQSDG
jgi:hypothetical protein